MRVVCLSAGESMGPVPAYVPDNRYKCVKTTIIYTHILNREAGAVTLIRKGCRIKNL